MDTGQARREFHYAHLDSAVQSAQAFTSATAVLSPPATQLRADLPRPSWEPISPEELSSRMLSDLRDEYMDRTIKLTRHIQAEVRPEDIRH